jgi:large subunit ribosomal protein L38e
MDTITDQVDSFALHPFDFETHSNLISTVFVVPGLV